MPFDPNVMFSPPPQAVRITGELIDYYKARAQIERSNTYARFARNTWRALKRFGCWFRRPSVDVALRGGCD